MASQALAQLMTPSYGEGDQLKAQTEEQVQQRKKKTMQLAPPPSMASSALLGNSGY